MRFEMRRVHLHVGRAERSIHSLLVYLILVVIYVHLDSSTRYPLVTESRWSVTIHHSLPAADPWIKLTRQVDRLFHSSRSMRPILFVFRDVICCSWYNLQAK